ncbi:MAG: hypothetical protein M1836_006822 [Candelina mexicana]|nr:MAG: hypothetical protein M1836_006822 [Candelina mexicana]
MSFARFMYAKWKILPYEAEATWPTSKEAADAAVDDVEKRCDIPVIRDGGDLRSDVDTYGTNEPLQCVEGPPNSPSAMQASAADKIKEYCKFMAGAKQPIINRSKNYGSVGYAGGTSRPRSGNELWFGISWDDACNGKDLKVEQPDCERLRNVVLNDCNGGPRQKKYGGQSLAGVGFMICW